MTYTLAKAFTVTAILTSSLSVSAISHKSHASEHKFNHLSPFISASVGVADSVG